MRYCTNCGKPLPDGQNFCVYCGTGAGDAAGEAPKAAGAAFNEVPKYEAPNPEPPINEAVGAGEPNFGAPGPEAPKFGAAAPDAQYQAQDQFQQQGGDSYFNNVAGMQYAPEPPKKKKTGLIIGIIVAVAVVAAGIAGFFIWKANSGTEVDLTSNIEIADLNINGSDGNATADWSNSTLVDKISIEDKDKAEAFLDSVTYSVEPSSSISNGDTVTVTAYYSEDAAKECNISVTGTSKSFEVSDLPEQSQYVGEWEAVSFTYNGVTMTPSEANMTFRVKFEESGTVYAYTNGESDGSATWTETSSGVTLSDGSGESKTAKINSKGQLELTMSGITFTMEKK